MKKSNLTTWTSAKAVEQSGKFEVCNKDESWAKGDITCMVFEEDCRTVRMTGIITESNNPEYVGKFAIWIAEDNGKAMLEASYLGSGIRNSNFPHEVGFDREAFAGDSYRSTEGNIKVSTIDYFAGLTRDNLN